ncbi:phosphate acetyltransferase [Pseudokineococcus marinus]|uniref:Phosphate acetyltransferase n=1 Tax=Pseudokineococcus marinus TaxID=351215 RepID=A0A849BIY0_9ACTN|nr:phosphate acetyltransferase [Pseudokineococcus marinus]NNH23140.1 phosphate acetyltransferase [Pseudokineococcus marinus]
MGSLYIASVEGETRKSTVALGVLAALRARPGRRVGVFRPLVRAEGGRDDVLDVLLSELADGGEVDDETYAASVGVGYEDVRDDADAALDEVVARYRALAARCDEVMVLGSDYTDVAGPTELALNARLAADLGTPVLLVVKALGRSPREVRAVADVARDEVVAQHAQVLGVVASRADPDGLADVVAALEQPGRRDGPPLVPAFAVPEDRLLTSVGVRELVEACDGHLVLGPDEALDERAGGLVVAAMSMPHALEHLEERAVVIVPGDRSEVVLGLMAAHASSTFPRLAGVVLTGGFALPPVVTALLEGLLEGRGADLPVVSTDLGTVETAARLLAVRGRLSRGTERAREQVRAARDLFAAHVDGARLVALADEAVVDVVTPRAFAAELLERARSARVRVVLPEGLEPRVLLAAAELLRDGVVDLVLLGPADEVRSLAEEVGADVTGARVVDPRTSPDRTRYAAEYARLRAHKGVTPEAAEELLADETRFGTLMVHLGDADGMVSGAVHTTAETLRPAFEVIKTAPGRDVVSSVFLMCLPDRVLVYGDCAVNPDPDADALADIAASSADTAVAFGVEPRVAMMSYSTGGSGSGAGVEKVRRATALVRERRPDLSVEGPIQYDAAVDVGVARTKLPDSAVAGRATVFVFPDLNTGNTTYKAVQRSAGAVAIGPVLQGLRRPVNDLSRGALVRDIVSTVVITAVQAQVQAQQEREQQEVDA